MIYFKNKKILLFGLGSTLNTGITFLLYLLLLNWLNYQWAYFVSYFTGIYIAYWYNSYWVFNASMHLKSAFLYPVIYIIQYFMSALLLNVAVEYFHLGKEITPILIMIMIFPFTYIMNKVFIQLVKNRTAL